MPITAPTFHDVLAESFVQNVSDGYWYPIEPGLPLVRVAATFDSYCVERRRNVRSPWFPVAAVEIHEFDAGAWREWRTNWTMVAYS